MENQINKMAMKWKLGVYRGFRDYTLNPKPSTQKPSASHFTRPKGARRVREGVRSPIGSSDSLPGLLCSCLSGVQDFRPKGLQCQRAYIRVFCCRTLFCLPVGTCGIPCWQGLAQKRWSQCASVEAREVSRCHPCSLACHFPKQAELLAKKQA